MFDWLFKTSPRGALSDSAPADDDAWRRAALEYVQGRLSFPGSIWPSQHEVDHAVARLSEAREWAATIKDATMRRYCERWCDHSQYCIDKAQQELRTKKGAMDHERWQRDDAEKSRRAREIIDRVRASEQDASDEIEEQVSA